VALRTSLVVAAGKMARIIDEGSVHGDSTIGHREAEPGTVLIRVKREQLTLKRPVVYLPHRLSHVTNRAILLHRWVRLSLRHRV
jgi:hypothetical protein